MFLEAIELTDAIPCLAEPGKIIIIGRPSCTLEAVLPYLASLPGVIGFNPEAGTLTFRREQGFITLYPDRVYITKVANIDEGLALLSALVDAINTTWAHRDELTAVRTARRAPRMLDVWSLLPQTNCKQCGEATCMAFAVALLQQKRELKDCAPLWSQDTLADQRAALAAILPARRE